MHCHHITCIYTQKKFSDSFANPEFIISDFAKFDRPSQLHIAFQALDKFRTEKGQLPRPYNKEDGAKFVEIAKQLGTDGDYKVTHLSCECIVWGGAVFHFLEGTIAKYNWGRGDTVD